MGKFSPVVQAPRYMQEFKCVGSSCVENCCTGWRVAIDKPTYQQYQTVKVEPLASMLKQHVRKSRDSASGGYAAIELKSTQACPFLDEARLCQIHAGLGAQALSVTCNEYPRVYTEDGDAQGLVASLSCPEAARLALSSADALDPVDLTLGFANRSLVPVRRRRTKADPAEADLVRKHAQLIGGALEAVVRQPNLGAAQALVYGGVLLRLVAKLAERPLPEAEAGLEQAFGQYLNPQALARAPQLVSGLAVPKEVQLELLMGATRRYVAEHGGRPSFKALVEDLREGLQLGADSDPALSLQRYVEAEQRVFTPFDAAHPHVLKNYLLNALMSSLLPRTGRAELEADFMALAVRFALIKFFLIGLAARTDRPFGVEDCIRVVYVIARNIEHNRAFMPNVLDTLRERDALRLEVLATLVL